MGDIEMRTSLKALLALGVLQSATAAITTTERAAADTVKHPTAKEAKAVALVPPNAYGLVPQTDNVRSAARIEVIEGLSRSDDDCNMGCIDH
jgi:hypothetical protein